MQRKEICEYMIITYLKALAKKVKKIRILKTSQMNIDFIIKEHQLQEKMKMMKIYGPQDIAENIDDDICLVDYTNKEASNFYEFYRILSQENYDLGKNMSEFLVKFRKENEDVTKAINLIPQQMEDIYKFTEECVATFNCYFNFGKSSTEKLLQYCRPAVEKFIFNKIYQDLYECYCLKYEIENQIFSKNQNLIRTNKTPVEIMKVIEVRKCFIEENPKVLPYKSTIDCINKIEFEVSPKDKFETLMKASLELRNSVLDVTRGKYELTSMDEELPLFMYLTSQVNIKNLVAELRMIEDYLVNGRSMDKESKVLTNLLASVKFMSQSNNLEDYFFIKC